MTRGRIAGLNAVLATILVLVVWVLVTGSCVDDSADPASLRMNPLPSAPAGGRGQGEGGRTSRGNDANPLPATEKGAK